MQRVCTTHAPALGYRVGIAWRDSLDRMVARHPWLAPQSAPPADTNAERVRVLSERRVLPRGPEFGSSSLRQARRRLGTIALGALPLTLAHLIVLRAVGGGGRLGVWPDLAVVFLQLALLAISRDTRLSTETALRRCAGVAVALGWALSLHWHATPGAGVTQLTPVSLLVVLLPLVIPLSFRVTVTAAALAALGQPATAGLLLRLGYLESGAHGLELSALGAISAIALAVVSAGVTAWSRSDLARDIGGYRLVRKIGAGGAGEVWEGRHRLLARPAAVKLLSPPSMSRSFLVRFEREAQATALLSSEHTVSLYDFGIGQRGTPYYVMEFLTGFDLQRLVEERGPLHPARVVHLVRQACDSLGEAHEFGIAHRDIKPSNLFVVRRGLTRDFLKVLDFGMVSAHDLPDAAGGLTTLSQDGFLYGTPAYMPAEQAAGGSIDWRADLYQLGCVMFFLLTGRVLFEKKSPLALAVAHASEPPPKPSQVGTRAVPQDLEAVVMRCLEKDPEKRYQSAGELLAALERLDCADQWTPEDAASWWRSFAPPSTDERTTIIRALRKHAL